MEVPATNSTGGPSDALPADGSELRTEILEYVLSHWDDGAQATRAEILDQFPDQEPQVDAVLAAVTTYSVGLHKNAGGEDGESAPALLQPGDTLGEFTVEAMIGQGGMGQVYRARQKSLDGRAVALKVLPPALVAADPRFVDRFRREASLAAKAHHAGLAQIYGSGGERGLLFFAMALVEGRSLREVITDLAANRARGLQLAEGWDPMQDHIRQAVRLVQRVASALGALHAEGLVHRDVKPANIILEGAGDGGALLEHAPILVDFGLLRPVGTSILTGSMTRIGTPAFASPECQLGREIDARADVFSLGAVLHDLLTLTPGGSRPPASAGLGALPKLNPGVHARLDAIVQMALEERPASRYADGQALEQELEAYLAGEAIRALPSSALGRLRQWVTRNPRRALQRTGWIALMTLPFVIVLSLLGGYVLPLYTFSSQGRRLQAEGQLERASIAFREVSEHPILAGWLPGLGDAYSQGQSYWTEDPASPLPALGVILAGFDKAQGSVLQASHEQLRVLLNTDERAHWRATVLSCLSSEIQADMPLVRREVAMETLAIYYGLTHLRLESQPAEEVVRLDLEAQLIALLSNPDSLGASKALLTAAAAALSGMPNQRVFAQLSTLLVDLGPDAPGGVMDLEACRRIMFCLERIWWTLRDSGSLSVLSQEDYCEWVRGGVRLMASEAAEDKFMPGLVNNLMIMSVWASLDPKTSDLKTPWPETLGTEALDHLEAWRKIITWARDEHETDFGGRSVSDPYGFRVSSHPDSASGNVAQRVAFIRKHHIGEIGEKKNPFATYLNIWNPPELNAGIVQKHRSTKSLGDTASTPQSCFGFVFDDGHPVAYGGNVEGRWSGASVVVLGETNQFFRFEAIGAQGLTLTAPIPSPDQNLKSCRVTLYHHRAARWFMPSAGKARIRISLGGRVMDVDAPSELTPLSFRCAISDFAHDKAFTLTVQLVGGTTTYRLHGIDIEWFDHALHSW